MMQRLSGKVVALSALVLFLSYIGYRLYETKSDAAALQAKTLEDAVPTVAIVHPKPRTPARRSLFRGILPPGLRRRSTRKSPAM